MINGQKDGDQDFAIFRTTFMTNYKRGFIVRFRDSQNLAYFTRLTFDVESGYARVLKAPARLSLLSWAQIWVEEHVIETLTLHYYVWKMRFKARILYLFKGKGK